MAGKKGRSGRKHIPTVLRVAAGVHECLLPKDEPQPSREGIVMPDYLSEDAQEVWKKAVKHLDECGIMTVVDEPALAHYCEQFVTWQTALESVRTKGLTVFNKRTGHIKANPAIKIANDAHDRLLKMMVEFGMTPSSRARTKTREGFKNPGPPGSRGSSSAPPNPFSLVRGGKSSGA